MAYPNMPSEQDVLRAAKAMAATITAKFQSFVAGQPEDQLKAPVESLLVAIGNTIGYAIIAKSESRVDEIGRPDFGVAGNGLLIGHVELKAPGTGANPRRFTGHDRAQWKRFQTLPNVLYTDGNEWALYRQGERIGSLLRFAGDVTVDAGSAVTEQDGRDLRALIGNFFSWQPITPHSPKQLAELLAPLCKYLRESVRSIVDLPSSAVHQLFIDWRNYLFPNADEDQFADAYAQTLVYAMLLAHFEGLGTVTTAAAPDELEREHDLLSNVLRVLTDKQARIEIETAIGLLERVISAVDVSAITRSGDPWIYFYEDFLEAYDSELRKNRGVYYTPAQVVRCQVALVEDLLHDRMGIDRGYADDQVTVLDPAAGTGTYPLAIIDRALSSARKTYGHGIVSQTATTLAKSVHAFELLVGPYAVAQLRITARLKADGASLPADGVHVYLTDTLQSPTATLPGGLPLLYRPLTKELTRALNVKRNTRILVCIGNPPYDREQQDQFDPNSTYVRKGGWVRHGVPEEGERAILDDFIRPAAEAGYGIHLKNLYNDYVYFWRWALWKVLESSDGPGIVSFITASSFLRGRAFVGMRQMMRQIFDAIWIIDLGGDNRGPRPSQNVFAIQTPVCITIGIRRGSSKPKKPASVFYTEVAGSRDEKLDVLRSLEKIDDLTWESCFSGWQEPFYPSKYQSYYRLPPLTTILPWKTSGAQIKRKWPISETRDILFSRWQSLLRSTDRGLAFRQTRDRRIAKQYRPLPTYAQRPALEAELLSAIMEEPVRYGYRSFDRRWIIPDARLGDFMRPALWRAHGPNQVYLATLFEVPVGEGPTATLTADIPDLDFFRGSFGGAHIVPMWRDAAGSIANANTALFALLRTSFSKPIPNDALFAYCYGLLSSKSYTRHYWNELNYDEPRIPITKDETLFLRVMEFGRHLIWLHSFAQRYGGRANRPNHVVARMAQAIRPISPASGDHPTSYNYDAAAERLIVGSGEFGPIANAVWNYSVSGLQVVRSWLDARMQSGSGRQQSSPLDQVRPTSWDNNLSIELLELLWTLEQTIELESTSKQLFDLVITSDLYDANEVPPPPPTEVAELVEEEETIEQQLPL